MKYLYHLFIGLLLFGSSAVSAADLNVVATVPELGDLAKRIGGDHVSVNVCVKPKEDPHALQARPSLIRQVADADAFIQIGRELEAAWAPALVKRSRNGKIAPGTDGFIDAASAIPADHSHAGKDRSFGDVHPMGNAHFLLDPVNGLRVAELITMHFKKLDAANADSYQANFDAFRQELGAAYMGQALAAEFDVVKLGELQRAGKLTAFLEASDNTDKLGGWAARLEPLRGSKVADDHDMWSYFYERFGLVAVVHLEPKPGMEPTTPHLRKVIETMKAQDITVILTAPYFTPKHHAFVARATDAQILPMAHQVGSQDAAGSYLQMIDHNVNTLAKALGN